MTASCRGFLIVGLFAGVAAPAYAQNDAAGNDSGPDFERAAAVWRFESGAGKRLEPGPRPPLYPAFAADNTALPLLDDRSALVVREADLPGANLRFRLGDSITLEAWVKVQQLKDGSYAYLVGKGRNGKPGFPERNQNYALRLKGEKGEARPSFLFASAPADGLPADWHRWTAQRGFPLDGGWHHVAVTYTFGQPASIRGYVDGQAVAGVWDLGGATTRGPVCDADDLVLGGGNAGNAGNALRGWLDDVMIWRVALPASVLTSRFQFVPATPVAVRSRDLPRGRILVEICEGIPASGWPTRPPAATESYEEEAFGFFAVPHRYVDTGVRADRANPFLLRASAAVEVPAGKHRLLLRARGASRLFVNDRLLLTTPFPPSDTSGHGKVRDPDSYLNLGPDFRFAPPGNRESWTTFESAGGTQRIVLETIVGGLRRRPELGETVVALSRDGSETWQLLTPGPRQLPYTDAGWEAYAAERTAHLDRVNAAARARCRAEHAAYWQRRRAAAQAWLARTDEVPIPELPRGYPAHNAIDHFLAAKLARVADQAVEAKKGTVDFFKQVQPLLEARCYDCHAGARVKGGLRLDDPAAARRGGDSELPAIVPARPEQSELLARVRAAGSDVMPPKGQRLTREQIQLLETWIREGAHWPEGNAQPARLTPLTDDLAFLRRVSLDTVGVVPSLDEISTFLADRSSERRARVIDRLLADPRWADHWMGYWQDVLAENPNILNPTLNNTGPFRWWIYESLVDNKPMDLFVTELLRQKGSARFGGPAGFGVASQNDVPMATKAMIVSAAFLGVQMKCARCHDSPAHRATQRDLFQLGAMLGTQPLTVPASSSVPMDRIHQAGRKPLISVTLKPGTAVAPAWPFADFAREALGQELAEQPQDPRDRLAALLTAPENERFAQVLANRLWQRLMGRGLVEPVDDWERGRPTHPELLRWLGRELVRSGYDLKHLARLILNSHAYQRGTDPALRVPGSLFAAPAPRRLTAEQIVDSLFAATGKPFRLEEVSLDVDGQRDLNNSITLGQPRRAWMLTSTSNERDRPSLALPRIQAVVDVLQAFGWRGARQEPTSYREESANVLQPAILSNGTMGVWLTRLSDDHGITQLALEPRTLDDFVETLFLKLLTRPPRPEERATFAAYLRPGYDSRLRPAPPPRPTVRKPVPYVSWSNHLAPEATRIRQQQEADARRGDPPSERLEAGWRNRLEDILWALLNSHEFVFAP